MFDQIDFYVTINNCTSADRFDQIAEQDADAVL